jgi:DNA polymerase V
MPQGPAPTKGTYALIDANHFYVSCQRVFDYTLRDRLVVVLSNNDGCCVARRDDAKALSICMGQGTCWTRTQGRALSSNDPLYADMSSRLMAVIGQFSPEQEVYSIDESFLRFTPGEAGWPDRRGAGAAGAGDAMDRPAGGGGLGAHQDPGQARQSPVQAPSSLSGGGGV